MQDNSSMTPAERELELAMSTLRPVRPDIDRDRVMFRAGQASSRKSSLLWQAATAVFALAFIASVALRPESKTTERIVQVPANVHPPSESDSLAMVSSDANNIVRLPDKDSYIFIRRDVLKEGADALRLPATSVTVGDEATPQARRMIRTSPQSFQRWSFFGLEQLIPSGV